MKERIFCAIRIAIGIAIWMTAILLWEYFGFIIGAFAALALAPRGFYAK